MRFSRITFAAISLSLGATGCAGLLGLDDFTEGESSSTGTTSSTTSGPGAGGAGAGAGGGSSTSTQSGPGGGGPGGGGVGGEGGGLGELVVTPEEPKVGILRPLQLEASIPVTWSVEEDDAGTIDADGRYVSPFEPGTYHVVATSVADDTVSETVEIAVVGLGVTVLGGLPGGPGNIDGQAKRAHFDGPQGVGVDDDDSSRIYIADSENHTIRKYDRDTGLVTTLAGKAGERGAADGPGADARFDYPTALAVDGSIWVADRDNDCIRRINPTTGATTTLAGDCGVSGDVDGNNGANSRFDGIRSMVLGPNATTLFVCQQGGSGTSIRRVNRTTGATSTVIQNLNTYDCALGTDSWRGVVYYTAYVNGEPTVRSFTDPYSVSTDLYVADFPEQGQGLGVTSDYLFTVVSGYDQDLQASLNSIYRVDLGDETTFQEYLGGREGYVDGDIGVVRLGYGATLSSYQPNGWLFFTDRNGTVRRLDVYQEEVDTMVGPIPNEEPVDGGRTVARIPNPIGIALDGQGFAFETNFSENDNRIRRIDLATGQIESFSGVGGDIDDDGNAVDGSAEEARFGIAVDVVYLDGSLYITDFFGSAVRRIDAETGAVSTIAGRLNEPGNSDGVGAAAGFTFAGGDGIGGGIATDGVDLYICDTANFKIKKLDLSSGMVTTLAGGTEGSGDGIGDQAEFNSPSGIAYSDGFLYVTEFLSNVVRKIDLSNNKVTTIAGRAGEIGQADGGLGTSTFTTPIRVVADGLGNLYVSEFEGNTIRRISLDDNVTTTFIGTRGARGFNAAPLPTTLNCPTAMQIDSNGDLIFADGCDGVVAAVRAL